MYTKILQIMLFAVTVKFNFIVITDLVSFKCSLQLKNWIQFLNGLKRQFKIKSKLKLFKIKNKIIPCLT